MVIIKRSFQNSLRLKSYDYSMPEAYFFTICTDNRACYFGNIVDGIMISSPISDIVRETWQEIPEKFTDVELDIFILMPNHVHGIIIINRKWRGLLNHIHQNNCSDASKACSKNQSQTNNHSDLNVHNEGKNWILMKNSEVTTAKIIRYFKAKSSKFIRDSVCLHFKWQPNYYEHIVRDRKELAAIREYILNNPLKWMLDRENRMSINFNMDLDEYFRDVFEK